MPATVHPLPVALGALAALLMLGAAPVPSSSPAIPHGPETVARSAAGTLPSPPTAPRRAVEIDPERLPAAARAALPLVRELIASRCPELPELWVVAQVHAESGWDAALTSRGPGGPAGLYQLEQPTWRAAGGRAWTADPPHPDADVTAPAAHLRIALPWTCANLRAVTAHLRESGKPTAPLDAMLVCHVAGCGRVTGSATGVPAAGEAGCDERCAQVVRHYLAAVHGNLQRFGAPAPGPAPAPLEAAARVEAAVPRRWTGGATGCVAPDPTGDGCLTGATRHGLSAVSAAFGGWSDGPVIRSAGCWDEHAWNPRSDHARGRACDLFPGVPGAFARGAEREAGWRIARWLRAHAGPLRVRYLIWQGRYWDPAVSDEDGWGRRYRGGGIYDVRAPTGGHFDHVHVSFRE